MKTSSKIIALLKTLLPQTHLDLASSSIESVDYNRAEKSLVVHFHNGGVYRYTEVEPEKLRKLVLADSAGKYFVREIRNRYHFEKL